MAESILPAAWQVPQPFRNRLGSTIGRQRAMFADGHLLLVLHAPPQPEEIQRRGRLFWRSDQGNWTSTEFGTGISALNRHLDQYENILNQLDRREHLATTVDDYFAVLEALSPIQRSTRNLHLVLQDARKMVPEDRRIIDARDRAYAIERTAELLFTATRNSMEFAVAKSGQRMAVATHRLNMLAAVFFPIVTVCAVLGIELENVAVLAGSNRQWIVDNGRLILGGLVVVGGVLGAVLKTYVSRRGGF